MADDCALLNLVRKQEPVVLSLGEAEFYAISTAATEGVLLKRFFEWLGFRVTWEIETDAICFDCLR